MSDDIFDIVRKSGGGARLMMEQELCRRAAKFADLHEDEGFVYDGIGDVLGKHGIAFEGGRLPEQYEHLRGPEQLCYLNALHAIEQAPELRYCEGLYLVGSHATNHGWCLDPHGELVDVTFGTTATHVRSSEHGTIRPVDPVEKWQYVGVVIPAEYAWEMYRNGSLPVLDDNRPHKRDIFKRQWRWDEHGREI